MEKRKFLNVIALMLLLAFPVMFYIDARGKVISINKFSESDISSIDSAFNITLSSFDKIEAFEYRTYAAESFYLLSIRTDSKDTFISKNTGFKYVEELPSGIYILPNERYIPKKEKTLYYTNDHVYVAIWSFEDNDIPKLFSKLYDDQ